MAIPAILAWVASWPYDPAVIAGIAITAALYWLGARYMRARGLGRNLRAWRAALFTLGLLTLFLTLDSPLDDLADQLLWAHMLQHELLALAVAPLLLLGEPLMVMWRGVPLGGRRAIAGWAVRAGWPARLFDALERFFRRPAVSWLTLVVLFSVWHLPALYDLATEHAALHAFEHLCFLFGGLVFWSQLIPSLPFKPKLKPLWQAVYFGLAAMWGNVLGWAFMFSTTPSYPYYAHLARTPGMVSAIVDEHIAGGVMDIADTAIFISCIMIALGHWLREVERQSENADDAEHATEARTFTPAVAPPVKPAAAPSPPPVPPVEVAAAPHAPI